MHKRTGRLTLLRFCLQGAHATPWRGVTRSSSLAQTGGFPADRFLGFAVECEYALALLRAGPAVHVPRVLYFKRTFPPQQVTASKARHLRPEDERRAAWQGHNRRMSALLDQALEPLPIAAARADVCRAALVAAMLQRFQAAVVEKLDETELHQAATALRMCESSTEVEAQPTAANLHVVLYQHWLAAGDGARAAKRVQLAWSCDNRSFKAAFAVAKILFAEGRLHEALELAAEAMQVAPDLGKGAVSTLIGRIYAQLGWRQPQ